MYVNHQCPRCLHSIPRDEAPGAYPGAKSRVLVDGQRVIEVCSICGEDEGYERIFKGHYTPVKDWPIDDWLDITKEMELAIKQMKERGDLGHLLGGKPNALP